MEYDSDIKRNAILLQAITWTNLENIMFSKIIQTQRTNSVQFYLYKGLRIGKFTENRR